MATVFYIIGLLIFIYFLFKNKQNTNKSNSKRKIHYECDCFPHISPAFREDSKIVTSGSTTPQHIPSFKCYYPTEASMSPNQLKFYRRLEGQIKQNKNPNVDGNISYLFMYTHKIIQKYKVGNYKKLYNELTNLSERYCSEKKFSSYCKYWAHDCLLALKEYDQYLELSEPELPYGGDFNKSNMRLNICWKLGYPGKGVDLFKMLDGKITSYTKKHATAFRDFLEKQFSDESSKKGEWLSRILAAQEASGDKYKYMYDIFSGMPIEYPTSSTIELFGFWLPHKFNKKILKCARDAENSLRIAHGVPKIGEGWVSETDLFYSIKKAFPETQVIQHGKPRWLGRQHLDIWLPRWKIAIEYHGTQHFEPVEIFGGKQALLKTQERDQKKIALCSQNKVNLIIATKSMSHLEVIEKIKESRVII